MPTRNTKGHSTVIYELVQRVKWDAKAQLSAYENENFFHLNQIIVQ